MRHSIVLDQLAPIPVGHVAELIAVGRTLALVRDQQTGIEYVPSSLATNQLGSPTFDAKNYVEELPAARLGGPRVIGRVEECRIVTHTGRGNELSFVTRLILEDGRG